MVESNTANFDEQKIINVIKIKNYLEEEFSTGQQEKVYICGTMYEHSIGVRYSYRACNFLIYVPFNKKLFFAEMNSDECFTASLKWNHNFYKKIRLSLESTEGIKNTYFSVKYEDKNNIQNSLKQEELICDDLDYEMDEKKLFLELHFLVENQDIVSFKLLLQPMLEDNPYQILVNKILEFDKEESLKLKQLQLKDYEKEREIEKMASEIQRENLKLENRKKDYIYKFYYLNKEKNKKINEISENLKKERKLFL